MISKENYIHVRNMQTYSMHLQAVVGAMRSGRITIAPQWSSTNIWLHCFMYSGAQCLLETLVFICFCNQYFPKLYRETDCISSIFSIIQTFYFYLHCFPVQRENDKTYFY